MPELPEVETIRLGLEKKLVGLEIKDIKLLNPKSFHGDPKLVKGQKVVSLWRKAKILGIDLTGNLTLLIHLKMSGQLVYQGKTKFVGGHPTTDMFDNQPNKSTRLIFTFADNSKLLFNDQRRFGWVKQFSTSEVGSLKFIEGLGPEPLAKSFTWQVLKERLLSRRKAPVKVVIMDQGVVSGIGNIYACEALFLSKIHPKKKVLELTDEEFKKLHKGVVDVLKLGIKLGGSSRSHYVNAEGKKGSFLDSANVYERKGKPCLSCKTPVGKIILGGRGTFYCSVCQK